MPNENRPLTPEEIEQYRAIARGMLAPAQQTHAFGAIANLLNAISGHTYLDRVGRAEYLNRTTRGAANLPPVSGETQSRPNYLMPTPRAGSAGGAIGRRTSQQQPQLQQPQLQQSPNVENTQPEVNVEPQAPPITTGPTGATETLAPSQPSPRFAGAFQPGVNAERAALIKFEASQGRQPTSFEKTLVDKYGVDFVVDVLNNPQANMLQLFRKHPSELHTLAGTLPRSLSNRDVNTITADEWYRELERHNRNVYGNRPITQQEIDQLDQTESPMMRLGRPPIEQPTVGGNAEPLNSPDMGVSPGTAAMPFRQPRSLPPINNRPPNVPSRGIRTAQADGTRDSVTDIDTGESISNLHEDITQGGQLPGPNQLPPGIPQRIPVNVDRIHAVERQLGNAGALPLDDIRALEQEYAKLTQPLQVQTNLGTAFYDPRTGNFVSFAAQPYNLQQGTIPMMPQAGNRLVPPAMGGNQVQPGNRAPQSQNQLAPPHPFISGQSSGDPLQDLTQYGMDIEASKQVSEALNKPMVSALNNDDIAQERLNTLGLMRAATISARRFSEGGAFRGPFSDTVLRIKQFLQNLTGKDPGNLGTGSAEVIKKLNIELAGQATRQLSNRPANFEFQTYLQAFPGLETSYDGALALIDVLEQLQRRDLAVADIARNPTTNRMNFSRLTREYDAANPIVLPVPDGPWLRSQGITGPIEVTGARVRTQADVDKLPAGTYFFDRNGVLSRKPPE